MRSTAGRRPRPSTVWRSASAAPTARSWSATCSRRAGRSHTGACWSPRTTEPAACAMGSIYGYELEGGPRLTRLHEVPGPRGRLRVEQASGGLTDGAGELTAWEMGFALARVPGGLLISCGETGDYELDPEAGRIRVDGGRLDGWWEHRLGAVAVPLLLSERGDLVLH